MLERILLEIGLTAKEASMYLQLLRIGPQIVSVIATRVGVNRTTAYSVLKSLEDKGLVECFNSKDVRRFAAVHPNELLGYVEKKIRALQYSKSEVFASLDKFKELILQHGLFEKPEVSYVEGKKTVRKVLGKMDEDRYMLLSGKRFWFFDLGKICNEKIRIVAPDTEDVRRFLKESGLLGNSHLLEDFESECDMFVDAGRIMMLNDSGEVDLGVLIEDKDFADMQRNLMSAIWDNK